MSTRDSPGGKGGRCVRLKTLIVPKVNNSGALTYPDPLGPSRRPVVGETFIFNKVVSFRAPVVEKKVKFDLILLLNGVWIRATLNAPYNFHLRAKLSSCLVKYHAIKPYGSVQHQASVVSGPVYDPTALHPWKDISVHTGLVEAECAAEPLSTLPRIKP